MKIRNEQRSNSTWRRILHLPFGTMTKTPSELNGVNLQKLTETIQAIKSQPNLATFKFRATNKWINGGHNQIRIDRFYGAGQEHSRSKPFSFDADEPPVLLGKDLGANPVEFLLSALSACLTTTLAYHAAAHGIQIDGIESDYEGDLDLRGFLDLDPKIRKGYREIRVNFRVKTNASSEQLQTLMKNSPVFDVVTNPTRIVLQVETAPAEKKPAAA